MKRKRQIGLAAVVIAVSLAHYLTPIGGHEGHEFHPYHAFYRWFYHLPIILAGFWFGLRGGLVASLGVTALYVPHVLFQWGGGSAEQWLEIALYAIVGVVTGSLSDRQKADRDRYKTAAEELDRAYAELKERTRILLETEAQLRHSDRLSALGRLSAGLAHEIRTPLASIRGAAEILGGSSLSDEEREEFGRILDRETDRLNRVVNQFLEFARPKGDGVREADLNGAVTEILALVAMGRGKGVGVTKTLEAGLPPVLVDPEQLRQVILNLVVNATQAVAGGGEVEVRTRREGRQVRLIVADSGDGIPEDLRDRIFDPFVTGRPEGTGLGLSIVKRILDNHGADILVRPRSPAGTEIEVCLPTQ